MTALNIILIIFSVILLVINGVLIGYSRKQINNCEDEIEKKRVKAKWQIIFGLMGAAIIVMAGVMIFTMF